MKLWEALIFGLIVVSILISLFTGIVSLFTAETLTLIIIGVGMVTLYLLFMFVGDLYVGDK